MKKDKKKVKKKLNSKKYKCQYCGKKFKSKAARNSHVGKCRKNNKNTALFKPSSKQLKLLEARLNVEIKPTITAECEYAGIDRSTYYRWMEDDDFVAWFNEAWTEAQVRMGSYLDKIGYMKSPKDYRYWEAMQMKYHKFARKEENITETNVHLVSDDEMSGIIDKLNVDKRLKSTGKKKNDKVPAAK